MFWHLGLYWLSVLRGRSCPILCDPTDCIPLGSSVHGLFQARILEWIAISYSRGSSQPSHWTHISYISCFGTPEPPARSLTRDGTQVTDPQPISKIVNNSSARRPFIYKPIQSAPLSTSLSGSSHSNQAAILTLNPCPGTRQLETILYLTPHWNYSAYPILILLTLPCSSHPSRNHNKDSHPHFLLAPPRLCMGHGTSPPRGNCE